MVSSNDHFERRDDNVIQQDRVLEDTVVPALISVFARLLAEASLPKEMQELQFLFHLETVFER